MAMKIRVLFGSVVVLTMMWLVGCSGHYTCGITFGSSTCTPGTTTPSTATAFAYVVDQGGTIDGYALNANAKTFGTVSTFTPPAIKPNTGGVGVVVAQGKFLYAVFEDLQLIYGWSIDTSGNLKALSGFPLSVPISGIASSTYNQQVVITNPAGTLLFISEFSSEQILIYQISSTGALTAAAASPFSTLPATLEPQNMAMDGQGRFLYVSEDSGTHSGSFVVGYSVSSTGALTEIASFNIPIWEMQGDPSGKYMVGISGKVQYLCCSDDKNLYVYSIGATGALSAVTGSPFATVYTPFNIAMQPNSTNGEFVYSLGYDDAGTATNPIEGYKLDPTTGQLTVIAGSPFTVSTSAAFGQFDQSGSYMFVYPSPASSVPLGVINVASSGALTETLPSVTLPTGGYFAVSDVP